MNTPNVNLYTRTPAQIVVYSTVWCPDCKRAKHFLNEHRVPFINVDIETDPRALAFVQEINQGKQVVPTILFPDGSLLTEPSNAELADKLGLKTSARHTFYDVIIVGSGPAGLTAAMYTAREGLATLVIEKGGLGGQAGVTQVIDNFPAFDEGISGEEFARRLVRQATRFGVELLQAQTVTDVRPEGAFLQVETAGGSAYRARAVLLASGASYRRLNIPGEEALIGASVHFCATCDGAFYQDKKVLVIGGGNSGFEEGLFLTRFARQVDIVEFNPIVRASKILQDKVHAHPRMRVFTNHAVRAFHGSPRLKTVLVEDRTSGAVKEWAYDGVFVFIGLTPNSAFIKHRVEVDEGGFIRTRHMMTSLRGLFAAGDVRAGSTKQAASAAGEGASAAIAIREYLAD